MEARDEQCISSGTVRSQQTLSIFSSLLLLRSSKAGSPPEFSQFLCSFFIHWPLLIPETAQQKCFVRSQLQLGYKTSRLDPSSAKRKFPGAQSYFTCWRLLDSVYPKNILPIRQTPFLSGVCVYGVLPICICMFVCVRVLVYVGACLCGDRILV